MFSVGLMLYHRLRRWTKIITTLGQRLVFVYEKDAHMLFYLSNVRKSYYCPQQHSTLVQCRRIIKRSIHRVEMWSRPRDTLSLFQFDFVQANDCEYLGHGLKPPYMHPPPHN